MVAKKTLDMNARFIQAMERLGHTGYTFSRELGTSEAVISNIRNGKNPPNIKLVQVMLSKFSELDPDWLIAGRGRMFRRDDEAAATPGKPILEAMDERLARVEQLLEKALGRQVERNMLVDESISGLERQVGALEGEVKKARRAAK